MKYIFAFLTHFAIFSIFLFFCKNSVNTNNINSIVMLLSYILQIFCNLPFNFWRVTFGVEKFYVPLRIHIQQFFLCDSFPSFYVWEIHLWDHPLTHWNFEVFFFFLMAPCFMFNSLSHLELILV